MPAQDAQTNDVFCGDISSQWFTDLKGEGWGIWERGGKRDGVAGDGGGGGWGREGLGSLHEQIV